MRKNRCPGATLHPPLFCSSGDNTFASLEQTRTFPHQLSLWAQLWTPQASTNSVCHLSDSPNRAGVFLAAALELAGFMRLCKHKEDALHADTNLQCFLRWGSPHTDDCHFIPFIFPQWTYFIKCAQCTHIKY